MKPSIYKSAGGEAIIMELYDRQLSDLGIAYEERMIKTRFGETHVIVTGAENGTPLLVFHGGNSTNPFSLKSMLPFTDEFRIYAPDTIGHPGKSAQTSLSASNKDYGKWASDIIDELGFDSIACMGASYGGGILMKLAAYAPEKIAKAVLIVPSGIANCSFASMMIHLGIPMCRYIISPSKVHLIKAIRPLAPDADEYTLEMVKEVFENVKVKAGMPKNATKEDLKGFKAPVIIYAGERDVMFPAGAVIERAKEIIPNLIAAEIMYGSPHMYAQSQGRINYINGKIRAFLTGRGMSEAVCNVVP